MAVYQRNPLILDPKITAGALNTRFSSGQSAYLQPTTGLKGAMKQANPAKEYANQPDNTSPNGETIPTGIGAVRATGRPVWWTGFNGKPKTSFAMVFLDCALADSFQLIRMKFNEDLVFSKMSPSKSYGKTGTMRFYDGTQTTPDPLLVKELGAANASSWTGFCYAVFENFDVSKDPSWGSKIPIITAELAGSIDQGAATTGIGILTFENRDNFTYQTDTMIGDWQTGRLYTASMEDGDDFPYHIHTFDMATKTEIDRKQLDPNGYDAAWWTQSCILPGTGHCIANIGEAGSFAYHTYLLDLENARIVTRIGDGVEWSPYTAVLIPGADTQFIVIGDDSTGLSATNTSISAWLVNVTRGTSQAIFVQETSGLGSQETNDSVNGLAIGPVVGGEVTIFYSELFSGKVFRVKISAEGYAEDLVYTPATGDDEADNLWYDFTDDTLIIHTFGSDDELGKWNIETQAWVWRIEPLDGPISNAQYSGFGWMETSSPPPPGYGLAYVQRFGPTAVGVNVINLADGSMERLQYAVYANGSVDGIYYDLNNYTMYEVAGESTDGAGNFFYQSLGDSNPLASDLTEVLTAIATLDGSVEASDLDFTGFPGGELYGLYVDGDTTAEDLNQTLSEMFNLAITTYGGKIQYRYLPRDDDVVADVTVTAVDIVEA